MKLTEQMKKVVSTIQYHGDESIKVTASALGLKESVVRRIVGRAVEEGVLKRKVYVNLYNLGLSQYSIFFSTNARSATQKARVRDFLIRSPFPELVLEVGGQFDYGIVVTVRSAFDVEAFFDTLTSNKEVALAGVRLHARTGWYYFGVKYLGGSTDARTMEIVPRGLPVVLSPMDVTILDAFTKSLDGNRQKIARAVGIPLSTVQYRIAHLQESGVIAGVLYQIVADQIGYESFRVLISTQSPSRVHRLALLDWARQHPSVLTFMHGVGNWEYELRIETTGIRAARAAVDELQDRFAQFVGATELIPVSRVLKHTLTPDPSLLQVG